MTATARGVQYTFEPGECVLCFEPDPTKARVLYDAKILDTASSRDRKGRRKPEYHVHFQGWNSSWDRIVPETFVLSNSDDNRALMRRLADIAKHVKRNKTRMKLIDRILKNHFKRRRPHFDPESSDPSNDSCEEDEDDDDEDDDDDDDEDDDDEEENDWRSREDGRYENGSNADSFRNGNNNYGDEDDYEVSINQRHRSDSMQIGEEVSSSYESDEEHQRENGVSENVQPLRSIDLKIPSSLKKVLEDDCYFVTRKNKLVNVPANPNIVTVLEGYVKHFAFNLLFPANEKQKPYSLRENQCQQPEKSIDMCKEVMDGLRVIFDFALPSVLLYQEESSQFASISSQQKPCVSAQNGTGLGQSMLQAVLSPRSANKNSHNDFSPGSPSHSSGTQKIPQLSPRVIKSEAEDNTTWSDDDFEGPSRRITRKAFAEEIRKSKEAKSKGSRHQSPESNVSTTKKGSSGGRGGGRSGSGDATRRDSLRGGTKQSNGASSECGRNSTKAPKSECSAPAMDKKLADRVTPPPPLLIPNSVASGGSSKDTPTSSMAEQAMYRKQEAVVNDMFSWRMLPDDVYKQVPSPPSLVYGPQHLCRLFVKLPPLLERMAFSDEQFKPLIRHIEMFVEYMSKQVDELFQDSAYVDVKDNGVTESNSVKD